MKKEILKKAMILGAIMLTITFMMGQLGVYAETDLDSEIGNTENTENTENKEDKDDDIVNNNNEVTLPEENKEENKEENTLVTEKEKDENTDITLTTNKNNTEKNAEELPYTGTVSNTVIISLVVAVSAFGIYTFRKANYYKNI